MLVTIANMEDPDQSGLGLRCLSRHFWQATSIQNFRTFIVASLLKIDSSFRLLLLLKKQSDQGIQ